MFDFSQDRNIQRDNLIVQLLGRRYPHNNIFLFDIFCILVVEFDLDMYLVDIFISRNYRQGSDSLFRKEFVQQLYRLQQINNRTQLDNLHPVTLNLESCKFLLQGI